MSTNRPRQRQRQRQRPVDLEKSFREVTRTLRENRDTLNAADQYNHNHGDNMVKNFQVINRAMRERRGSDPAEQLAYASQVLSQQSSSGSGQMYAQGLERAAQRIQGQQAVTPETAMTLVQALMGSQPGAVQPGTAQGDAMSSMLGALMSGQGGSGQGASQSDLMNTILGAISNTQGDQGGFSGQGAAGQQQFSQGDPLSTMLGGLLGGLGGQSAAPQQGYSQQPGQGGQGIDMQQLMAAGMTFMQARQRGASPVEALVQAVMAGSKMNNAPHHSQSGQMVAGTLINAIGKILGGLNR